MRGEKGEMDRERKRMKTGKRDQQGGGLWDHKTVLKNSISAFVWGKAVWGGRADFLLTNSLLPTFLHQHLCSASPTWEVTPSHYKWISRRKHASLVVVLTLCMCCWPQGEGITLPTTTVTLTKVMLHLYYFLARAPVQPTGKKCYLIRYFTFQFLNWYK